MNIQIHLLQLFRSTKTTTATTKVIKEDIINSHFTILKIKISGLIVPRFILKNYITYLKEKYLKISRSRNDKSSIFLAESIPCSLLDDEQRMLVEWRNVADGGST